jgi:ferrous iron transport protein B
MWDKTKEYLKKIAGVILIASIIFWSLSYFPQHSPRVLKAQQEEVSQHKAIDAMIAKVNSTGPTLDSLIVKKKEIAVNAHLIQKSYQREDSYLGQFGKFIEPAIKPLGFDWKMGISLISGLTAKEIIVSTLAVLYHADEESANGSLPDKLKSQKVTEGPHKGEPAFTPLLAFVFMIFVSIYFPCIGSIIAISRESGSAKWGLFAVAYTMSLAWIISFIVFQGGQLLGL